MERITHRYKDGEAWASIYNVSACGENECKGPIIDRLAAYEDTGLTPEDIDALQKRGQGLTELLVNISCECAVTYTRLRELAQAEKDGRLAVAPCKEGNPVWWVDVDWTPGDGKIFHKISSGKFRYAMLDWQNPIYTSQAAAEAALAEMARGDKV